MSKVAATIYGLSVYLVFLGVFLYAPGFVGNYLVPKSIDSGTNGDIVNSIAINLVLLGLFAFQHSLMARPFFKTWWEKFVPPVIERSTYVLFTSLILALIFWQWQPLKDRVWEIAAQPWRLLLQVTSLAGWLIVLTSTFMISHFELFGLRQIYLNLKGAPYRPLPFTSRYLYRFVRHPLMLGFIVAFWATPDMTLGHFIFAVATTSYILIGIQLEEHDLLKYHSKEYGPYREKVPMLIPLPGRSAPTILPTDKAAPR